ncbi:MAG: lipopolysaccharide kinase InaA family protein [Candidatus Hydrogenedentes bacterium]|nr:lipopolysaccharide kinase InaA family protein [Candidatus Hydrogenedentota bacterium]
MGDDDNDNYCSFERNGQRGFAARTDQARIVAALLDRANCEPVTAMGRGALHRFPLKAGTAILREYRRGGAIQRLLPEGSIRNRPLQEWEVLHRLYEADFPVPEPLGVLWRRRIGLVYGAIATRELNATDLLSYLSTDAPSSSEYASILELTGTAIRRMHDLGVYHADLHVGNILVSRTVDRVFIIDFDRARSGAITPLQCARNLLRLQRSFVKRGLRLTDFERIRRAYGPLAMPSWLEWAYGAKGSASDVLHRHSGKHVL